MFKCEQEIHTTTLQQLPVYTYFDEILYQQEKNVLFNLGPKYIGHELMLPNIGSYYTVPQDNHSRVLMRDAKGINLMSNVCKHRQALMLKGIGTTQNIVCPLHLWTYDKSGELISAPHFEHKPCANLSQYQLQSWNGMLFEGDFKHKIIKDLTAITSQFPALSTFKFSDYVFHSSKAHECNYNWKTFIEVYLEDYHVNSFHPGLGNFVNCDDLTWNFGEDYSIQMVGLKHLQKSGSKVYQMWHEQLLKYTDNKNLPEYGAIWLTYYPNIMVEWYPFALVISTLHPTSTNKTQNIVEFYYPEEIGLFEPDFIASQQAAYMETCIEDDEIAIRMDSGRYGLHQRGISEVGPYQSPMEDGMEHFHKWYRKHIDIV
ncbi:MAG: hypothetical protein RLZZ210_278 [Pseudomonadota bacterium]|jgi:phenylpropionate dioxygenase-like ring-hydroxylating dioxygenase large terminal subunit